MSKLNLYIFFPECKWINLFLTSTYQIVNFYDISAFKFAHKLYFRHLIQIEGREALEAPGISAALRLSFSPVFSQ